MRWIQRIVLFGALMGAATGSQQRVVSEARTEEKVEGLLELPDILGDFQCAPFQPKSINFYAKPSKDQPAAGLIEVRPTRLAGPPECYEPTVVVRRGGSNASTELPTEESGYEVQAAVVYEHSAKWFRIALEGGSGWIEREASEGFLPYPAGLLGDSHLTYLREEWDGKIWSVPGSGPGVMAPQNWLAHRVKQLPIRVLSTRTIGRDVWIQIHFETEDVCGETVDNVTPLEGWIPAYRPEGATSVWFHSRGC